MKGGARVHTTQGETRTQDLIQKPALTTNIVHFMPIWLLLVTCGFPKWLYLMADTFFSRTFFCNIPEHSLSIRLGILCPFSHLRQSVVNSQSITWGRNLEQVAFFLCCCIFLFSKPNLSLKLVQLSQPRLKVALTVCRYNSILDLTVNLSIWEDMVLDVGLGQHQVYMGLGKGNNWINTHIKQ